MRSCVRRRVWPGFALKRSFFATPTRQATIRHAAPADDTPGRTGIAPRIRRLKKPPPVRFALSDGHNTWVAQLDEHLPAHLRLKSRQSAKSAQSTGDLIDLLFRAQRSSASRDGVDLLFHLGVKQDRWTAVVWLLRRLVESFGAPHNEKGRLASTLFVSRLQASLDEVTEAPIEPVNFCMPSETAASFPSLDALTDDLKPERLSDDHLVRHEVLGLIWRSLGLMTIACADGEMRPEILEVIAYLHHMGIMPMAIYDQDQPSDTMSPLLHHFSSRILTILSDAAWRAQMRLTAEAATAEASQGQATSHAVPSMRDGAVRMNAARLRPEVWLELILWSCLQGGWIADGAAIISALHSEPEPRLWKPLFHSLGSAARDANASVHRTISAQVVNAYVDALLNTIRGRVGDRGEKPGVVLQHLSMLRHFLRRSKMSLQTGSWDAVILRFYDSQDLVVAQSSNFDMLVGLSSIIGDEVDRSRQSNLPAYVMDGSAAILGLLHRAMQYRISVGDLQGSLHLFTCLQDIVDSNRRRSVADFFRQARLFDSPAGEVGMFTGHAAGIEYPSFDMQLPPTILGPFLDLICDSKAYGHGKRLLESEAIDVSVVPESQYGHPAVGPALLRFAVESGDTRLLSKMVRSLTARGSDGESLLPLNILASFLDNQIGLGRWSAAERILMQGRARGRSFMQPLVVAKIIRSLLFQTGRYDASRSAKDAAQLERSKGFLADFIRGKFEPAAPTKQSHRNQVKLLLSMLSTLSPEWAEYCLGVQSLRGTYTFAVSTRAFNRVLEGVVSAYGNEAGHNLLNTFWPPEVRTAQQRESQLDADEEDEGYMSRYIPTVMQSAERQRVSLTIPGHPEEKVVWYGGLRPNFSTVRIILGQAVQEFGQASEKATSSDVDPASALHGTARDDGSAHSNDGATAFETILWAVDAFRSLLMRDSAIIAELRSSMSLEELEQVRDRLPDLFAGEAGPTPTSTPNDGD